jgi:hypothetical protein
MATTATGGKLVFVSTSHGATVRTLTAVSPWRRRRVSPETGRAIEMLGHAIEYLADEFALECMSPQKPVGAGMHPRLVAIEILKKCSRVTYLSCPEIPSLGERIRAVLSRQRV